MYTYNITAYPWGAEHGKLEIDTAAGYGYFDHKDGSEGGGLWFDGQELSDYDGVYELPKAVARTLIALGYTLE